MMCENPYIKSPAKPDPIQVIVNPEARLAATPFGCGQCLPCRINKQRTWQNRLMLEASEYKSSTFVTLTYSDDYLPDELSPKELVNYIRRVKNKITDRQVRYFAVGEYGKKHGRPHYHIALFNTGIEDTEVLHEKWQPRGFTSVDPFSDGTARYITKYALKRITGEQESDFLSGRHKEFTRMSRNKPGGLGLGAILKIAERINKHKYVEPYIIRRIGRGKQSWPLGRYLSLQLADRLGIEENQLEEEFRKYQDSYISSQICKGGVYKDQVLEDKRVERQNQKRKAEIFRRREKM